MRLFIAIDFDEHIKNILNQYILQQQKAAPGFRWIKKPALHLTLKFLGESSPAQFGKIIKKLNTAFLNIDPFELETTSPAFFPNPHRAKVYFLGLKKNPALLQCYNIIEDQLSEMGISKENRTFNPHITLARIKQKPDPKIAALLPNQQYPLIHIPVNDLALMRSDLRPDGARYTVVQRFSLRTT